MEPADDMFLNEFFNAVVDRPLEPDDERYVSLYDEALTDSDPVRQLARVVEWSTESVRLFSGYRGAGKSTELRRLKRRLEESGHLVFLCDMEEYLNLSTAVDISDFLMAVAGSFDDAIRANNDMADPSGEGYWDLLTGFLGGLELKEIGVSGLGFKASLKSDPTFKQRLQQSMAGHLGSLVNHVRGFCCGRVAELRKDKGDANRKVVLLLDSVEHIRGTLANAEEVQSSVETLFAGHAEKLRMPGMHLVYTVPPYLKVRYPNIGQLYDEGCLEVLPSFKLHEPDGVRVRAAYNAFEQVVRKRGDWTRLLGCDRAVLDRLIRFSGGHLRDLLRLLAEVALRARVLPVPESSVEATINQIRSEFLPIANDDARWLARIAQTHQAELQSLDRLPSLARFFDTHLVLCYRNGGNGEEWYDVHPLVAEQVHKQTAALNSSAGAP